MRPIALVLLMMLSTACSAMQARLRPVSDWFWIDTRSGTVDDEDLDEARGGYEAPHLDRVTWTTSHAVHPCQRVAAGMAAGDRTRALLDTLKAGYALNELAGRHLLAACLMAQDYRLKGIIAFKRLESAAAAAPGNVAILATMLSGGFELNVRNHPERFVAVLEAGPDPVGAAVELTRWGRDLGGWWEWVAAYAVSRRPESLTQLWDNLPADATPTTVAFGLSVFHALRSPDHDAYRSSVCARVLRDVLRFELPAIAAEELRALSTEDRAACVDALQSAPPSPDISTEERDPLVDLTAALLWSGDAELARSVHARLGSRGLAPQRDILGQALGRAEGVDAFDVTSHLWLVRTVSPRWALLAAPNLPNTHVAFLRPILDVNLPGPRLTVPLPALVPVLDESVARIHAVEPAMREEAHRRRAVLAPDDAPRSSAVAEVERAARAVLGADVTLRVLVAEDSNRSIISYSGRSAFGVLLGQRAATGWQFEHAQRGISCF